MFKVVEVKALEKYKIWIRFADGIAGEVDLSHLVGKGVFSAWLDYKNFAKVSIGSGGEICWSEAIDLCPDAIYLKLTGKNPEEAFQKLSGAELHA